MHTVPKMLYLRLLEFNIWIIKEQYMCTFWRDVICYQVWSRTCVINGWWVMDV